MARRRRRGARTTPSSSATTRRRCPTRARCAQPARRARGLADLRPRRLRVDRRRTGRARARPLGDLRAARRHVHAGGHLRLRDRAARPPRRPRHRPRRGAAGQLLRRSARLGLRRRPVGSGARAVRRPRRIQAVRRRVPRARASASCSTSSTTTSDPRAPTSAASAPTSPARTTGGPDSTSTVPDSDEVRALRPRQRAGLVAGLPRRRAAPRRRPRAGRHAGAAPPRGPCRPRSGALSAERGPPAHPDRRERPQRPADRHAACRARARHGRPVVRRPAPRAARPPDRRDRRLLRRLRAQPGALAKTLRGAFFHDGTWSSFRGRTHGRPVDTAAMPGSAFLAYLQNHDQIGNRAAGDRISATISPGLLACGAAIVLLGPYTPMLFMGEEWAASTPWQFFASFPDPELAEAVRTGRRREFGRHGWGESEVPDPMDPATYERSKLDWSEIGRGRSRRRPGCLPIADRAAAGAPRPLRSVAGRLPGRRRRDSSIVMHRGSLQVRGRLRRRVVRGRRDRERTTDWDLTGDACP